VPLKCLLKFINKALIAYIMLIDVHCHLDFEGIIERLDKVIDNARKADVKIIVSSGITPETNRQMLDFAKKYDIVKPSFGLYPMDA